MSHSSRVGHGVSSVVSTSGDEGTVGTTTVEELVDAAAGGFDVVVEVVESMAEVPSLVIT